MKYTMYLDRGNLHLVFFPLSIGHGHMKNNGGPSRNWDKG